MSIFKPVTLSFKEKTYTIPADKIMPCLAMVEDVITLEQLSNPKKMPLVKLSQAYGVALRYAGANVTDEQVYECAFIKAGTNVMAEAVAGLLQMMIPPTQIQAAMAESDSSAKKPVTGKPKVRKS